MKWWVRWSSGS